MNLGGGHLRLRGTGEDRFGLAYGADLAVPIFLSRVILEPHVGVAGVAGQDATSALEFGTAVRIGEPWTIGLLLQLGLTENSDDLAGSLFLRYTPRFR